MKPVQSQVRTEATQWLKTRQMPSPSSTGKEEAIREATRMRRHPATPRATGDISESYHRHGEVQENQFWEDRHDEKARYTNDAKGWVRAARGEPGCNDETAENYPGGGYDKGNSWRLGREKSLDWGSGSDHREKFVKPGDEAEFEKRGRKR
jgi:hypothetical protein